MSTTTLPYETHNDGGVGGPWYPAVNVKVHALRRPNEDALADHGITDPDALVEWLEEDRPRADEIDLAAWEIASEMWWRETLPMLVDEWNEDVRASHGETFDPHEFYSAGRSGGWCVYTGPGARDHDGSYGDSWDGWSEERRRAFAELADRVQDSARTEGPYSYWWYVGRFAVEHYGYHDDPETEPSVPNPATAGEVVYVVHRGDLEELAGRRLTDDEVETVRETLGHSGIGDHITDAMERLV